MPCLLFLNFQAKINHLQKINPKKFKLNGGTIVEVVFLHIFDNGHANLCSCFPANNDISLICTHKAPSLTEKASGKDIN